MLNKTMLSAAIAAILVSGISLASSFAEAKPACLKLQSGKASHIHQATSVQNAIGNWGSKIPNAAYKNWSCAGKKPLIAKA